MSEPDFPYPKRSNKLKVDVPPPPAPSPDLPPEHPPNTPPVKTHETMDQPNKKKQK